ncbi:hypothetical protein JCM10207_008178 [Rhodosporidiobolus poonsookiae]
MSVPAHPETVASKRALSASPSPPPSAVDAAASSTKKIKLAVEDPVSVPPNLVEQPVTAVGEPAASTMNGSSSVKPNKDPAARKPRPRKQKAKPVTPGGAEEAAAFDIVELLGADRVKELERLRDEDGRDWKVESEKEWGKDKDGKDVEVRVVGISGHGDGLAILTPASDSFPTRILSIPFALPDETVRVHIHRHEPDIFLSHGDLLEIVESSPARRLGEGEAPVSLESEQRLSEQAKAELAQTRAKFGDRVQCRYFGQCSGCQYQPLSYEYQLKLKQDVVRRAFANFSGLDPSLVPAVGLTLPSPLQYAYRTKLTPHFQTPPTGKPKGGRSKKMSVEAAAKEDEARLKRRDDWELTIGFEQKGRRRILDIEDCPIATEVINRAMTAERQKVHDNIASYKRGATLLLRDSLPPRATDQTTKPSPYLPSDEPHVCITDHHATVREQVGPNEFEQQAGSFFQNNNSILPSLLDAVREAIGPRPTDGSKRYLVDAYTGSGLFAISLADMFDQVEGVEIDKASIRWAKRNAEFNKGEGRGEVGFRDGKAEAIFKDITFPSSQTTLVIDPPRKGCDTLFLDQLLAFGPSQLVYVSCNVRTQARDIGYVLSKSSAAASGGEAGQGYRIESLRGADLFPNTHHIEGLAVLRRI